MDDIGFIGLGIMGRPMALNLVKGGFRLNVYSRDSQATNALVRFGAKVCTSAAQVAENSEAVITMLTDSVSVREVVLGDNGIVHGAKPGTVVIDMSTIDPSTSRDIAVALLEKDIDMLDAPVSGGEQGAKDGTLSIMVGGPIPLFRRSKPLLQMMGNCTYVGEHGCGQIAKACNQLLVTQTINAVAEAMLLAKKAGADPDNVRDALLEGSAYSKILDVHGRRMLERQFQPGFRADLHAKDITIIRRLAEQVGMPLTDAESSFNSITSLASEHGDQDSSAVITVLEQQLGVTLSDGGDESKKKKVR